MSIYTDSHKNANYARGVPRTRFVGILRRVGQPRQKAPRKHKTETQSVFVQRVKDELADRGLSALEFSKIDGAPKERTISDVLNGGAVPRLTFIHQCAKALNLTPSELLTPKIRRQENMSAKVSKLPERYEPIFAKQSDAPARHRRNKSRA